MGFAFDDVGALAMLHALADSGQVNILGIVSSNNNELSVPCINLINVYYGKETIPTGATKNEQAINLAPVGETKWTEKLVSKYHHTIKSNTEIHNAVTIYRKLLIDAEDKSVTICSIGLLTNLSDLLQSQPDTNSSLTGLELIRKKVKILVCMGGEFPEGKEFNLFKDISSSLTVLNQWPTDILFSGGEIGSQIISGKSISKFDIQNSPVKDAYEIITAGTSHFSGMSWDQTAVLVAVKGHFPYFSIEKGKCILAEDGSNTWQPDGKGSHSRLILKMKSGDISQIIDQYMKHLPMQ